MLVPSCCTKIGTILQPTASQPRDSPHTDEQQVPIWPYEPIMLSTAEGHIFITQKFPPRLDMLSGFIDAIPHRRTINQNAKIADLANPMKPMNTHHSYGHIALLPSSAAMQNTSQEAQLIQCQQEQIENGYKHEAARQCLSFCLITMEAGSGIPFKCLPPGWTAGQHMIVQIKCTFTTSQK